MLIGVKLTKEMVYEVLDAWEREHPGQDACTDMSATELGDRLMEKIKATAKIVHEPTRQRH
jgi:NTP pyrophosphatase (non-canonical NTP hydrolase)